MLSKSDSERKQVHNTVMLADIIENIPESSYRVAGWEAFLLSRGNSIFISVLHFYCLHCNIYSHFIAFKEI